MTKQELEKLIERYDRKFETAFRNYQETGIQRYERERHNAEDMAEALRMALSASDDHEKLIGLKYELARLAIRADKIGYMPEERRDEARRNLVEELLAVASVYSPIDRMGTVEQ